MAKQVKPPSLRLIALELTKRCNLACKHCRAKAIFDPISNELTNKEIKMVFDDITTFAKPIVILTGGEPLLREDVLDLAFYGSKKGLRMVLATNGTLLDDHWVGELKEVGIKRVSVSLDGASSESHDSFRAIAGAFEATMLGINALKRGRLDFQINTTVTKSNLKEILAVEQLAIKLGAVAHHIFLLVPMGRGEQLVHEVITAQEYEEVLKWLLGQKDKNNIHIKATCAPQYYRILRQQAKDSGYKITFKTHGLDAVTRGCLAGMGFCFIGSSGKVQTCGYLEVECGDVRKEPLSKIWRDSKIFNKLRDKKQYKGKCGRCEYWQVCGGCRARAYALRGDYLAEEPMCLYIPKG
jgi:heme b synthase